MQRDGKRINMKGTIDSWMLKMGYPVVTVTKSESPEDTVLTEGAV